MNDFDLELFEADLKRLRPARPPEDLLERLEETRPGHHAGGNSVRAGWRMKPNWPAPWGWLAAAGGVAAMLVSLLVWNPQRPTRRPNDVSNSAQNTAALKADKVDIDQQLVESFDAVAQLPNGEPVRFRCSEWRDQIVLRDSARGVVIQRQIPRFEVVPVRFETY